jgi:hypothetical protein
MDFNTGSWQFCRMSADLPQQALRQLPKQAFEGNFAP